MRTGFTYSLLVILIQILSGCGRSYLFPVTQTGQLPEHLWAGTDPLKIFLNQESATNNPSTAIVKVHSFQAVIKEVLKFNEQHVSDFQLVNARSLNAVPNHGERFQYELNFYVIEIKRKSGPNSHFGLLTTTGSFEVLGKDKTGSPTKITRTFGLGPAYAGTLEKSMQGGGVIDFRASRKYKINRDYTLKLSSADNINIMFTIDKQLIRHDMTFLPDEKFRIMKVVNHEVNKISGKNKSLEFCVPEIFSDQDILTFYFQNTP